MKNFNIADIIIEMNTEEHSILNRFEIFSSDKNNYPDLKISFNRSKSIIEPQGEVIIDRGNKWVRKNNQVYTYYIDESKGIETLLEIDKAWRTAKFTYIPKDFKEEYPIIGRVDEALFYGHILQHRGIVIHASAIEWNGKGIIFSAPGDTGKSTHANLWKRYLNAQTINDDRPVLRLIDKIPFVYGSPWCGSSQEVVNSRSPLEAVVLIEQAPENSIIKLENKEAISMILPRCFLPYFDQDLMDLALENIEKIIGQTPVYLLRCRPDKEAMELVYECVK